MRTHLRADASCVDVSLHEQYVDRLQVRILACMQTLSASRSDAGRPRPRVQVVSVRAASITRVADQEERGYLKCQAQESSAGLFFTRRRCAADAMRQTHVCGRPVYGRHTLDRSVWSVHSTMIARTCMRQRFRSCVHVFCYIRSIVTVFEQKFKLIQAI